MKGESRIYYLDIIRIIACVMVIAQHSPIPDVENNPYIVSACSFINYASVGLFFMVSGALLLPVEAETTFAFYKHRLAKIAIPTLIWSAFYFALTALSGHSDFHGLLRSVALLPFAAQGTSAFWFIYVMAGLYLFAPVISPWIMKAPRREIRFFLFLWLITLLIPVFQDYLAVPYGYYSIYCYFGGYLGYFVLGYYFHAYQCRVNKCVPILLIVIPIALYALCKTMGMKSNFHTYYYLSVFSASMTAGWFLLIQTTKWNFSRKESYGRWVKNLSNSCFGIYLVHIFVMRELLWKCSFLHSFGLVFQIVATTILTILISYVITRLISKLPFSKLLIGY